MVDLSKFKPGTLWKHPSSDETLFFIGLDCYGEPVFQNAKIGNVLPGWRLEMLSALVPHTEPRKGKVERWNVTALSGTISTPWFSSRKQAIEFSRRYIEGGGEILAIVDRSYTWTEGEGLELLKGDGSAPSP